MYNFKHFFNFKGLPEIGRIEIFEPIGFDGSTHKIEQEEGRFGRDVVIGNEQTTLTITRDHFTLMNDFQMLPDGTKFNYASQGFDYIVSEISNKGWETEIEYIIQQNRVDFITGIIDGYTAIVSQDEIKFQVIQNTKREEIKRREDIYVNAFSDKDLDGNDITPCTTTNILLKAKPIAQTSKWKAGYDYFPAGSTINNGYPIDSPSNYVYFNNIQNVLDYGIDDTLSYLENRSLWVSSTENPSLRENFNLVRAVNQLSNITLKFRGFKLTSSLLTNSYISSVVQLPDYIITGTYQVEFYVQWGFDTTNPIGTELIYTKTFTSDGTNGLQVDIFEEDFDVLIPNVPIGARIFVYGKSHLVRTSDAAPDLTGLFTPASLNGTCAIDSYDLEITATSTAIDSVIKGVRLIDLMKHNVNSVGGVPLNAPIYDLGGEHYDNFAFNGYLLGQIIDKPFNNRFKDITDINQEICADYQIKTDVVEILPYDGFYTNNEIAAFPELPNEENESSFNKRFFLKEFWLGYNKSSDARQNNGNNTIDDVHTDSQWMFPSKKTDGVLKLNINHSRSAYLIEEQRKRAINTKKDTSLQYDESLFLLDVVSLSPGSRNEFTAFLNFRNNDLVGEMLSDGSFNWTLLGFNVGNTIIINGISVVVTYYDSTVIRYTLPTSSFISGQHPITINYPLTNVEFVNRTNEGFSFIDGVLLPNKYNNLNYSIKRNIQRWLPYLATAGKYIAGKSIKNTLFKVNGELVTRKTGETDNVVDKADININDISNLKILNPILHKVSVFADFDTATQLFEDVQNIKGFVRVQLNTNDLIKGYTKEANYEWSTNKLTLTLEEKYTNDFIDIISSGSDVYIDGIIYENMSFAINNNFVSLYDSSDVLISKIQHFTTFKINGINYDEVADFSDALIAILT